MSDRAYRDILIVSYVVFTSILYVVAARGIYDKICNGTLTMVLTAIMARVLNVTKR